jgi:hypothetical protein
MLSVTRFPDQNDSSDYLFNGVVYRHRFSVSRKVLTSNTFLPLLNVEIQESSYGSLIFLSYQLFRGVKWVMATLLFVALCTCCYFFFVSNEPANALFCFLFISLNYAVAQAAFNRQVKITQETFNKIID